MSTGRVTYLDLSTMNLSLHNRNPLYSRCLYRGFDYACTLWFETWSKLQELKLENKLPIMIDLFGDNLKVIRGYILDYMYLWRKGVEG